MSWIYIIAVIIFAIVSNVNKVMKNKQKGTPRSGMPTFGGEGDNPARRNKRSDDTLNGERQEQSGSGFPAPATSSRQFIPQENREYDASPAFPEPAYRPTPNYASGEGMSLEQPDERDGIEARTERMRQELEMRQAAFDGIGSNDAGRSKKVKNPVAPSTVPSNFSGNRDELRNGLIWAEILGPPRSRKPHSSRR